MVGFRRGEWGGSLYWFSKSGNQKYEISSHQINQFIKRNNKIYGIEGLSHLGISEGRMVQIQKSNNKWKAREYLKFNAEPEGIATNSNGEFIVVTSKDLIRIASKSKIYPIMLIMSI